MAIPYCLSAAAYSICLRLPSIAGGHLQPENRPCCGDRDPPNMERYQNVSHIKLNSTKKSDFVNGLIWYSIQ
jgi:hypothetical protein